MAGLPTDKNGEEMGFKCGDAFKVVEESDEFCLGDIIYLTKDDDSTCPWFNALPNKDYSALKTHCIHWSNLEPINKGDSNMSETINVATAIRDSGLTENQRILREQQLVDSCGNITDAGKSAIWAILLNDKEDELVAAIKAATKETTKAKK